MAILYFSRSVLGATPKPIYIAGQLAEFSEAGDSTYLLVVDSEKDPKLAEGLCAIKGTKGIAQHTFEDFDELKKKCNDARALKRLQTPVFKQLFRIAGGRPQPAPAPVAAHVAVNPPPLDIPQAEAPVGHPLHRTAAVATLQRKAESMQILNQAFEAMANQPLPVTVPVPERVIKRRSKRTIRPTDDPVAGSVRAAPTEENIFNDEHHILTPA